MKLSFRMLVLSCLRYLVRSARAYDEEEQKRLVDLLDEAIEEEEGESDAGK